MILFQNHFLLQYWCIAWFKTNHAGLDLTVKNMGKGYLKCWQGIWTRELPFLPGIRNDFFHSILRHNASGPCISFSCKKSVYHFKEANVSISIMIYVPQYRDRYQLERFEDNPGDDKGKPGQKWERKIFFVLILLPLPLHQIVQRSVFWGSRETPNVML